MRWLCIGIVLASACAHRPAERPAAPPERFVVMTYNVNYGLSRDPDTLAAIRSVDADVVFLQEITRSWKLHIERELEGDFEYMAFHTRGAAGGLAVLSRYPVVDEELTESPIGWFPSWRVRVDTPQGPIQVVQVHLKPPVSESGSMAIGYFSSPKERLEEIEQFTAGLDPEVPALVVGDFNEKRRKAVRYLEGEGFTSVLDELNPKAKTWRWGVAKARIDHIFHSEELVAHSAEVVDAGRSDHLPVVATFSFADSSDATASDSAAASSSMDPK